MAFNMLNLLVLEVQELGTYQNMQTALLPHFHPSMGPTPNATTRAIHSMLEVTYWFKFCQYGQNTVAS